MTLWEWCDEEIPDESFDENGDASVTLGDDALSFLDTIMGLPGMADVLASAEVKWLQLRSGGRVTFPNLGRHNGSSAKTRASEVKKKQRQRSRKCPENVPVASGQKRDQRIENRDRDKKENTKRKSGPDLSTLKYPQSLPRSKTEPILQRWLDYKTEIGDKLKTNQSFQEILNRFSSVGPDRLSQAVSFSISNGYKGIFEQGRGNGGW